MSPDGVLVWLEGTAPAVAVRDGRWTYALTESAHLVGLATLFGAIAIFDLRLLGVSRRLPVTVLARHALPWSRAAFALTALSGFLLFSANASQVAHNTAFQVKILLIGAAGLNIWLFHTGAFRTVRDWDVDARPPPSARAAGLVSLGTWTIVIVCGRLIAYT
ncbi:DUF6644 family protein [Actinomadura algeriensis]|uniref:DUF6644 domain-containing protein n=1 Tax=Actinomadura algeriensis TaxID=1679523 RepID=A0ABR9JJV5_9ACTN|nr:DUF6644 family protein [Actinomadura algeriensis]MBE1530744.1 hypothetical protein [Actinomadura algeriensis]